MVLIDTNLKSFPNFFVKQQKTFSIYQAFYVHFGHTKISKNEREAETSWMKSVDGYSKQDSISFRVESREGCLQYCFQIPLCQSSRYLGFISVDFQFFTFYTVSFFVFLPFQRLNTCEHSKLFYFMFIFLTCSIVFHRTFQHYYKWWFQFFITKNFNLWLNSPKKTRTEN